MVRYKGRFIPKNPEKYKGDLKNIIYRSLIEYRFMKYFDLNSSIIEWSSEELYVYYNHPYTKKQKRYFPDFVLKIKKKDGTIANILVEVKCDRESRPPAPINLQFVKERKKKRRFIKESMIYEINRAKWTAAKEFCEKHNWEFKILTDKNLPKV